MNHQRLPSFARQLNLFDKYLSLFLFCVLRQSIIIQSALADSYNFCILGELFVVVVVEIFTSASKTPLVLRSFGEGGAQLLLIMKTFFCLNRMKPYCRKNPLMLMR